MGRHAKPIAILKQTGKKHLTKAEIKEREESEIKLGKKKLVCPEFVKSDLTAYEKWKELEKIFKGFPNVSSSDSGVIARYCITHSQYLTLIKQIKPGLDLDELVKLEGLANKKMDLLIKLEDRLFLNPLAKVKTIPKKEEKKKDPLADRGFGNV